MTATMLDSDEQATVKIIQLRLQQTSPEARARFCALAVLASQSQSYLALAQDDSQPPEFSRLMQAVQNDLPSLSPSGWLTLATSLLSALQPLPAQGHPRSPSPIFATTPPLTPEA